MNTLTQFHCIGDPAHILHSINQSCWFFNRNGVEVGPGHSNGRLIFEKPLCDWSVEDGNVPTRDIQQYVPVQQLIRFGQPRALYHPISNIDVVDANLHRMLELMDQVIEGKHVMLADAIGEDRIVLQEYLLRKYDRDAQIFIANLVNLTQSEN